MSHWLPRWIIATIMFINKQLVYVGVGKRNCKVKHFDSWKFMLIKPLNVKPDESYEEVSAP